jgi:hypothetical protein
VSGRSAWHERLRRLAEVRVAGTQLGILLTLSLGGTALVIGGALAEGRPSSVLAALAQRGVVVHRHAPSAASSSAATAVAASADTNATTASTDTAGGGSSRTEAASSESGDGATPTSSGGEDPAATTTTPTATTPSKVPPKGTKVEHVFVISLESAGYDATFGTAAAQSYLVHELVPRGVLLTQYQLLDDADLPNAIALASGQPPNPQTQQNCSTYTEIPPTTKPAADGAIAAGGCVYPVNTLTLPDQLGSAGHSWRAYVQGTGEGKTCRRPGPGAADDTLTLHPEDPYATRHNPFVYFHSLLDLGDCATNDVDLGGLTADLATLAKTPNLSVIVPDLCHDGSADACAADQPGGTAAADAFLAEWVPKILASPAYRRDGLLVVTFGGVRSATSPATTAPGTTTTPPVDPTAARHVGALLVSRWAKPGTTDATAGDPYALLRTVEDLFGLTHLARAGGSEVHSFAPVALGTSAG